MMKGSPYLREALLYEVLPGGSVACRVCERRCRISEGNRGFCGSRMNVHERLYALTYGNLTSITNNPIEKKPLFHYWPGSRALSAGSWGCNLRCVYCQNYTLSMADTDPKRARYTSPEEFVSTAGEYGSKGLSFTFNEASCTLLEYIIDCYKIATRKGLYCNLNTNNYITFETLSMLIDAGLNSLCVDIKGDETFYRQLCNGADPEHVWRNTADAKKRGIHVEVVNLIIPNANDGGLCIGEIISRTCTELGRDTPLHFTRYYPAYKAKDYNLGQVTPVKTLERARNRALEAGLKYVYTGNVPGHEGEDTYCPSCKKLLIDRFNFRLLNYHLTDESRCPLCSTEIKIVGEPTLT